MFVERIKFVNNHPYMEVEPGLWCPAIMGGAEPDSADQTDEFAKVQDFIKEQVKANFDELSKAAKPADPAIRQTEQDAATQHVRDLISPFVQPGIDEAKFTAADAKDYVSFYKTNPDALGMSDQVEQAFTALVKAGRPTTRADVLRYLVGKEAIEQPDKFNERRESQRKRELDRASSASDMGATATQREKADSDFKSFPDKLASANTNSDELHTLVGEMEKAMMGVAF